MALIDRMRKQTAVYWAPDDPPYSDVGAQRFLSPREILVRWEDVQKSFVNPQGETRVSNAIVYVGEDTKVGGVLLLGTIETNVDDPDNPYTNNGAFKIQNFSKTPDLKVKRFLRKAFL